MKRFVCVLAMMAACGGKKDAKPASGSASGSSSASASSSSSAPAKVKAPPVDAVCQKARDIFGGRAECVETEMPELASPAGKVVRVMQKDDPTATVLYALVAPNGDITVGRGSSFGIGDEVTKHIDLANTAPDLLAKIYAELDDEFAIVRCLPGANDTLPQGKPCAAPALSKDGDKQVLTAIIEEFPDPRPLNRDSNRIMSCKIDLDAKEQRLSSDECDGIVDDPKDPRPASLPPLPTMTSPPDWAAKPEEAPQATSDALCNAAQLGAPVKCKAYGYPSVGLPNGTIYYLANDAGQLYQWAFQKTDGTIVAGADLDAKSPVGELVADYDPAKLAPEKLITASLLLNTHPAKIRCLGGDKIDGVDCKPPTATKTADGVHAEAIIEELGLPDAHGMVDDPAIRDYEWDFTPGGGYSGNGTRLVDLRDDTIE